MSPTTRDLTELTGSERQVRWAEDLRDEAVDQLTGWREDMLDVPESFTGDLDLYEELVDETIEMILSHEGASWWIDTMKGRLGSIEGIEGVQCMPHRREPVTHLARRYEEEHGTPMHEEV